LGKEHAEIIDLNVELLDAAQVLFVIDGGSVDGESFFRVFVERSMENGDLAVIA
jgi:hypothetical protein